MSYHAVVTVDLDNFVSSTARSKFDEELKKKKFVKRKLTTLWTVTFAAGASRAWAEKYVRDGIDAAAASAGISTYEAFVSISDAPPVEWRKKGKESLTEAIMRFQN